MKAVLNKFMFKTILSIHQCMNRLVYVSFYLCKLPKNSD